VVVYRPGGVAEAASTGIFISLDTGHYFGAGDKFLLNPGSDDTFTGLDTVQSTSTSGILMNQSYTIAKGDILLNLGADTGTASPNYDASPLTIYSDMDGGDTITDSTITADSLGEYKYWHDGREVLWELLRNSAGSPQDVITDAFDRLVQKVSVKDYGARGDGSTDDTQAIQAALDSGAGTVFFPSGVYIINNDSQSGSQRTMGGIAPSSNQTLQLEAAAILRAHASAATHANIIRLNTLTNVRIIGGQLDGSRDAWTGSNEQGHGITLWGATDIYIDKVLIQDCFGDGIYVGTDANRNDSERVYINGVKIDDCRRNNISLTGARQVRLTNSILKNAGQTNGTAPKAGLDIEPNANDGVARDIVVSNCSAENNVGAGFTVSLGANVSGCGNISFVGCNTRDNNAGGYLIAGQATDYPGISVVNCTSYNDAANAGYGAIWVWNSDHTAIVGNVVSSSQQLGISVRSAINKNVVVANNSVYDSTWQGIVTEDASGILIEGNQIVRSGRDGIRLEDSSDCLVVNNYIEASNTAAGNYDSVAVVNDTGTTNNNEIRSNYMRKGAEAPQYAIDITAGCTNTVVRDNNLITGGNTGIINDGGTNSVFRHNLTGLGVFDSELSGVYTWDPESLADGAGVTTSGITVTGAAFGDYVNVAAPYDVSGVTVNGWVSAADEVQFRLQNETGATRDLASGSWWVRVYKA
jgi:parallel beta-helix repeat protein